MIKEVRKTRTKDNKCLQLRWSFISHSKEEATMDAQAKINGATGGDDTARSATTKLVWKPKRDVSSSP
jgi:hypothetical protein